VKHAPTSFTLPSFRKRILRPRRLLGRVRKNAKDDYYLRHVSLYLSVGIEHLGSHWTDFYEIWYLIIFRKPVEEVQFFIQI